MLIIADELYFMMFDFFKKEKRYSTLSACYYYCWNWRCIMYSTVQVCDAKTA